MTSLQRREQLIEVGRSLFAAKGFEAVSVEEIAAHAKVSKPIVYEHFGGKEGLYAVIVDREMRALTGTLTAALDDPTVHPRQIVERTALALLTYIEENAEGFQVLVRDSPSTDPSGSFSSLMGDIAVRVEDILSETFKRQMLVGMTVFTGQYWADRPKVSKEQLAAYIVDLAWHGLSRLDSKPQLFFEGAKARKEAERRAKRESDSGSPDSDQTSSAQSDPEHATGEDSGLQNMSSGAQVTQHSAESGDEVLRFEQETEHND